MTGPYTELHTAEPIPHVDPMVDEAVRLLREAADILEKHNIYNNGVNYEDYLPSGLDEAVGRLIEPFTRLYVSGAANQAPDVLGYAALLTAYIKWRCPKSRFAEVVKRFSREFWQNMKKYECGESKWDKQV